MTYHQFECGGGSARGDGTASTHDAVVYILF